ncbi:MAG: hypothetical protein NVSMB52_03630 [Chloroflexota bacterium]
MRGNFSRGYAGADVTEEPETENPLLRAEWEDLRMKISRVRVGLDELLTQPVLDGESNLYEWCGRVVIYRMASEILGERMKRLNGRMMRSE